MMIGTGTPMSWSVGSARQSSSPVSLSNATTRASSSPPTMVISRGPSTSGALLKPHIGGVASYSDISSLVQTTAPLSTSMLNSFPVAPMNQTRSPSTVGVTRGPSHVAPTVR